MRGNRLLTGSIVAACIVLGSVGAAQATCTLPYTLTNGATADASQVMANLNALATCINGAGPGGSSNAIQYNAGGALGGVGPLTNGQLVIGATGAAPQAAALTAGPGISITNGAGGITIGATGGGGGAGLYGQVLSATPTQSGTGFTTAFGSPVISNAQTGINLQTSALNSLQGLTQAAPTPPYTITALVALNGIPTNNMLGGIGWSNGTAFEVMHLQWENPTAMVVTKWSSSTSYVGNDYSQSSYYWPQIIWMQLHDDGTNISFSFSLDGTTFSTLYSVAKASGYLGSSGYSQIVFFVFTGGSVTGVTLMSYTQS